MTHTTSRTIIALAALAALVAPAYVLFHHPEDTCDSIFENATATFDTKLEFKKGKGELLIGNDYDAARAPRSRRCGRSIRATALSGAN